MVSVIIPGETLDTGFLPRNLNIAVSNSYTTNLMVISKRTEERPTFANPIQFHVKTWTSTSPCVHTSPLCRAALLLAMYAYASIVIAKSSSRADKNNIGEVFLLEWHM